MPDTSTPKYSCANCLYAYRIEGAPAAFCRRWPPQVTQSDLDIARDALGKVSNLHQTAAQFPIVMLGNWCGEHKKEKEPREKAAPQNAK